MKEILRQKIKSSYNHKIRLLSYIVIIIKYTDEIQNDRIDGNDKRNVTQFQIKYDKITLWYSD